MNTKYDFGPALEGNIVYVRQVAVADLPADLREKVGDVARLYAVHGADGERLALVRDRAMAFSLARQNEMAPVSAH